MIYWSVAMSLLLVLSPFFILAMMVQIFLTETGIYTVFPIVWKGWTDMMLDINDPVGAANRREIEKEIKAKAEAARLALLPPAKPKDYFDTLDYAVKQAYLDVGKRLSYHPDNDPKRSELETPFEPGFTLISDDELLKTLKHSWLWKAQEMMMISLFTKSKWDKEGYSKINDIFFTPYNIYDMPDISVTNDDEHKWLKECWSISYDKLEYYKTLMNRAYYKNKSLKNNKEFVFKYKIISKNLADLLKTLSDSASSILRMAKSRVEDNSTNLVKFFFDFRDATMKNNMYDFFSRANKKNR